MKTLRKTICIIISIAMLCLTACGTQQPSENLARTVEVPYGEGTATFEFNEKGLLVAEKNKPWGAHNAYYTYDEENRITEITRASFGLTDYEDCERVEIEYYSDGKIKNTTSYRLPENEPDTRNEFIYDNGKIERINNYSYYTDRIHYNWSVEYYYTETEDGLIVTSRNVSSDGSCDESSSTYDKNGKLILEEYPGGACITKYVYDEKGNLIKEIEGDNEFIEEYRYENGLLVKSVCVKDNVSSAEYCNEGSYTEYEYFDNGNIKVISMYNSNDELGEVNIEAVDEIKGNFGDINYIYF